MPISATGSSRPPGSARFGATAEAGFTLIELMVVIAIMALATATVLFTLPVAHGTLRSEAERFALRARAARDAAIMQARPIALVAAADGYRFEGRRGGRWERVAMRPFDGDRWEAGTRVQVTGGDGDRHARTVFDPTGVGDPLDLVLTRGGARATVHIGADGGIDVAG